MRRCPAPSPPPLHRESWDAYLQRLAKANRIPHTVLHKHLGSPDRIPPEPRSLLDVICDLSGQPRERLLRAIPDLRPPKDSEHLQPASLRLVSSGWKLHPACGRCLMAKGVTEVHPRAWHWAPISTKLCLRHRRWTDDHTEQFELHPVPDVIHAQRRHHRLSRRHGWKAVTLAMRTATELGRGWWDSEAFTEARNTRITALCGPGWIGYDNDPKVAASAYPEIVALTELLASPSLRELPFTGAPADMRHFIAEVRARIIPGYQYDETARKDPLVRWIQHEAGRRMLPDPLAEAR